MRQSLQLGLMASGAVLLGLLGTEFTVAQKEEKLKAEDVVAKHLQSLGDPAKVAAVKTRRLEGTADFKIVMGGAGNLAGNAKFVSDEGKLQFLMVFEDPMYHGERVSFDGEKLEVGTLRPGARTPVGDFLFNNNEIVREGLFGGVLSTAWPLKDLAGRQARLKYDGIKTVNGQKVHVLRYQAKKQSGDLEIKLYFEAETFQHAGTLYKTTAGATIAATPDQAARQENLDYALEESFSDFKDVTGMTLPARWKISYSRTTHRKGNSIWQWELNLNSAEAAPKKPGA